MGKFEFQGYSFDTAKEMNLAKQEAESIEYIKAKMELKNREKAKILYDNLVEKQSFVTPIGIQFMKELQQDLSLFSSKPLAGVPVRLALENVKAGQGKLTQGFIADNKERNNQLQDYYKNKLRNSSIMNLGFVLIIIAMFLVVLLGKNSPLKDSEQKLQDKYATWEEQLKEKELLLQEKEAQLNSAD